MTALRSLRAPRSGAIEPAPARDVAAVALWAALVAGAALWGNALLRTAHDPRIGNATPLTGTVDVRIGPWSAAGAAAAILGVAALPLLSSRLGWRRLVPASALAAAAWAIALAIADGPGALTAPLTTRWDYLATLPLVRGPDDLLSGFTESVFRFSLHAKGHPPGVLLLLWTMHRFGFGGARWLAVVVLVAGSCAVPAVLLAVREVSNERAARRVLPFLALAPAALWVATSVDAIFMGVGAWGVTMVVLASRGPGRRSDSLAASGGAVLGAAMFCSYGAVLLAAIPAAVLVQRRRPRVAAVAALGGGAVALAFAASGFSWFAGLAATRAAYYAGVAGHRPAAYFVVANLAAFAIAAGPATAAALARLRDRGVWLLCAGALVAVGLANASGLSRGEVERIWLPFVPWVMAATCVLPSRGGARLPLGLSAASALFVQATVRTPW